MRAIGLWIAALGLITACGGKIRSVGERPWSPTPQSAAEAREARYQYAFTAQVVDAESLRAIPDFSVDALDRLPVAATILNPMGDSRGLFHLSRAYRPSEPEVISFPLLISAPGREPVIEWVDFRTDCDGGNCPGEKATLIGLRPLRQAGPPSGPVSLSPAAQALRSQGLGALLQSALARHKLDPEARRALSSGASDATARVLLLLGGTSGQTVPGLVAGLLGGSTGSQLPGGLGGALLSLLPLLVSTSPEAAAAFAAVSQILPYLKPVLEQMKSNGKGGKLVDLLLAMAGGNQSTNPWVAALAALLQQSKPAWGQWAMGSLLPLLQGMASGKTQGGAASDLLAKLLQDPAFQSLLANPKGADATAVLQAVLPLLHGLVGGNGAELVQLLNRLLAGKSDPLQALKDFPSSGADLDRYGRLIPFLAPLIDGLEGGQGKSLAAWLAPLLKSKNPGAALRAWALGNLSVDRTSPLLKALYPGLSRILRDTVPEKQLLASQLLSGFLGADLSDLAIEADVPGASAVIVRGNVRDLLKVAQLPNVVRMLGLEAR